MCATLNAGIGAAATHEQEMLLWRSSFHQQMCNMVLEEHGIFFHWHHLLQSDFWWHHIQTTTRWDGSWGRKEARQSKLLLLLPNNDNNRMWTDCVAEPARRIQPGPAAVRGQRPTATMGGKKIQNKTKQHNTESLIISVTVSSLCVVLGSVWPDLAWETVCVRFKRWWHRSCQRHLFRPAGTRAGVKCEGKYFVLDNHTHTQTHFVVIVALLIGGFLFYLYAEATLFALQLATWLLKVARRYSPVRKGKGKQHKVTRWWRRWSYNTVIY